MQLFEIEYTACVRFEEKQLTFNDPDGLELHLIERTEGPVNHWNFGGIQSENAIKGFGGATLISVQPNKTADVLEHVLGLACIGDQDGFLRFQSESQLGNTIDIKLTPSVRGLMSGTNDPICSPMESADLKSILEYANAKVDIHWENNGHQLTATELEAAAEWYRKL